ncbi:MAG: S41 family peptidase [Ruminococcaceae bacterium]|nr:S41 family peptidase [Oscillospiraceae bacterium]
MYRKKHILIVALCVATVTWIFACFYFIGIGGYDAADPIMKAKRLIEKTYVNPLTEEQQQNIIDGAISGMVSGLGDPYSRYLNTEALSDYEETRQEKFSGIGVTVRYDAEEDAIVVVSCYENSPAERAGILPGDILVQAGDILVSLTTYEEMLQYIREGSCEDISLTIRRGDKTLDFMVHREEIRRQSIHHTMYSNCIGFVRISEFIHNTTEDFAAALTELQEQNMEALIIDLRGNPGGYAESVLQMTDMLLPEGVIAYLEDNNGKRQYFNSDKTSLTLPMVVLINSGTASASELMAGSLQAHGLATIIGEKSYGKAVGQALYALTPETALYLTNARYFTPKGDCIDGVGIEPDILVTLPTELIDEIGVLTPEEDPQLAKALTVLEASVAR